MALLKKKKRYSSSLTSHSLGMKLRLKFEPNINRFPRKRGLGFDYHTFKAQVCIFIRQVEGNHCMLAKSHVDCLNAELCQHRNRKSSLSLLLEKRKKKRAKNTHIGASLWLKRQIGNCYY